jgi:uncharacterized protein (DUF433 family)
VENGTPEHIVKTPSICGGRACIAGHRIRVLDIVVWNQLRGYSPDEIVAMFPGISLADVHAALAYYFDNRSEIDEDFASDEKAARELLSKHPSKISGKLSA